MISAGMRPVEVAEWLERIGVGRYHALLMVVVGGVWLVDGAEMMMASAILHSLQASWGFDNWTKGWMMSVVGIGVFVGNLFGGWLADRVGRRAVVVGVLFGLGFFGIGSAMCSTVPTMIGFRFGLGASYGCGIPSVVASIAESSPESWAKHLLNMGTVYWAFGEVYTSILLWVFMPNLVDRTDREWRLVLAFAILPSVLLIPLALGVFVESPMWLAESGRPQDAFASLRAIASTNGCEVALADLDQRGRESRLGRPQESTPLLRRAEHGGPHALPAPPAGRGTESEPTKPWWDTFTMGSDLGLRLVCGSLLCFLANLIFFGMSYVLPGIFAHMPHKLPAAAQLFLAAASGFPGAAVADLVISATEQDKVRMVPMLGLTALCCFLCTWSLGGTHAGAHGQWALETLMVLRAISFSLFSVIYVWVGRVFHPSVRCTALAICIGGGRIGTMAAPLYVEYLRQDDPRLTSYFRSMGVLCLAGIVVVLLLVPSGGYQDDIGQQVRQRRASGQSLGGPWTPGSSGTSPGGPQAQIDYGIGNPREDDPDIPGGGPMCDSAALVCDLGLASKSENPNEPAECADTAEV